jgi:hypothetical protein
MEVKVGLVSYYIKSSLKNTLCWISLFLYLLSLINTSITSPRSGEELLGLEVLLMGWMQTYFGLVTFHILSALPWLGNIAMFLTVIGIFTQQQKQLCLITSICAVICTVSFIIYPVAMLGEEMKLITVKVNSGAYMWLISSVLLFCSSLLVPEMPNKQINQDK